MLSWGFASKGTLTFIHPSNNNNNYEILISYCLHYIYILKRGYMLPEGHQPAKSAQVVRQAKVSEVLQGVVSFGMELRDI